MKAFNSRKTCKQHWLFKKRFGKLSLTNKDGLTGVFKVKKIISNDYAIFGEGFTKKYCIAQINKIIIGSEKEYSIGKTIRWFEIFQRVQIADLGLTRYDFLKNDIVKIDNALKKYRKNTK